MSAPKRTYYRAKEFAERAGVTVRTLHFYDRLGLLSPSTRTDAGYRLYTEADLERLEQIVALRFVGFDLERIKTLLSGSPKPLAQTFASQREIIAEQRRRLDVVIDALDSAQRAIEGAEDGARWQAIRDVIEAFKMKDDMSFFERYYTQADLEKLAQTRAALGSEGIHKAENAWSELIAEVEEAAKSEDPSSPRARELARRWNDLVGQFTQNDPGVAAGLKKFHADQSNWPSNYKRPWSDAAGEFIRKASAAAE